MIGFQVGSQTVAGLDLYSVGVELFIDHVDRSALLGYRTLRVIENISARNTANFTLIDSAQTYHPIIGEIVDIRAFGVIIFKGTIEQYTEEEPLTAGVVTIIKVKCVDFNQLADRFLVAKSYEAAGQTLQDIIQDIVDDETDLDAEGVTVAPIVGDPLIELAIFDYATAGKAFDDLARESGYVWNIGYDKVLTFSPVGAFSSGVKFLDAAGVKNYITMKLELDRGKYRNRQFIRGEKQTTEERTEKFVGDSTVQAFLLAFEVSNDPDSTRPTITLNGVVKTVGVRGAEGEQDFDWFYTQGDKEISQDLQATPITSGETLAVTYIGQFPFIVEFEVSEELATRSTIEGGTGLYENLEVDEDIRGVSLAIDRAAGFLRRFGHIPTNASIDTYDGEAQICETVVLDLAQHGISNSEFLVQQRRIKETGTQGQALEYNYRASSPPEEFESWREFFQKLFLSGKKTTIGRANELLLLSRSSQEDVTFDDTAATSTTPGDLRSEVNDEYTAMRINTVGGQPGSLIGVALFGPHNAS